MPAQFVNILSFTRLKLQNLKNVLIAALAITVFSQDLFAKEGVFHYFESSPHTAKVLAIAETPSVASLRIDPQSLMQSSLYLLEAKHWKEHSRLSKESFSQSLALIQEDPILFERANSLQNLLHEEKPLFAAFVLSDPALCTLLWPESERIFLDRKYLQDEDTEDLDQLSNRYELWEEFAKYLRSLCAHLRPLEEDPAMTDAIFTSKKGDSLQEKMKNLKERILFDFYCLSAFCYMQDEVFHSPKEKAQSTITALNKVLFQEQKIRFPHLNQFEKDLATHSDMKQVLDQREGVCLGVSILYYALAKALDLSLELVTPPGHIYPRYRDQESGFIINIETTAFGAHFPSSYYEGSLTTAFFGDFGQLPTVKTDQIAQMLLVNEAAQFLTRQDYLSALNSYKNALAVIDPKKHLKEEVLVLHLKLSAALLGLENSLNLCQKETDWRQEIKESLRQIQNQRSQLENVAGSAFTPSGAIFHQMPFYVAEDLLEGLISYEDAGTLLKVYYDPSLTQSRPDAIATLEKLSSISSPSSLLSLFPLGHYFSKTEEKTPISARYAQVVLCSRLSSIRGDYYHGLSKKLLCSILEEIEQDRLWHSFPREAIAISDIAHHLQERDLEKKALKSVGSMQVPLGWFPSWAEPSSKNQLCDLPFFYLRARRYSETYLDSVNK